jgi:[protein-PII] uridylyltransferase
MAFWNRSTKPKQTLLTLSDPPPDLMAYRIPFKIGESPVESARAYLQACREQLKKLHETHFPSDQILQLNTLYIDDLVITLFERADWLFQESHPHSSTRCALMALGGYGRREMNIHSDVDLLFVYPNKPEEYLSALTDSILYVLWDLGLDVGYATRSIKDCRKIMKEDLTVLTSLLDARYLAGDREVADEVLKMVEEEISSKSAIQKFVEAKNRENEERLKRYGGSIYILEPNVKECEGGLRDFQTLHWFARVLAQARQLEDLVQQNILSDENLKELIRAQNFLFEVRNAIHFRTTKKNDQLTFQYQEEIAKELGFADEPGALAVEKFMQTYYQHAGTIKRMTQAAIATLVASPEQRLRTLHKKNVTHYDDDFAKADGKIVAKKADCFEKDPLSLLKVFLLAQKEGCDLDEETRRRISSCLHSVDENFIQRSDVNEKLKELFGELKGLGRVLQIMHELRLLERLIPEFGEILFRPQHDVYHIYTVDTHSIIAVGELSKLKEGKYDAEFPLFKEALEQTPRHDLLSFGLFFHDVGKGRGKNHSVVGAEIAARATLRMGYSEKDREVVEFLVKSHLLMPHLAQRRDLDDANLIIQFAKSMQHMDHLNMLFLLTWADIRAVGPEVWTPWKGTLLSELYTRTRRVLESGSFTKERVDKMVEQVKEKVRGLVGETVPSQMKEEFLQNMPLKYFLGHTPEEISYHLKSISETAPDQIVMKISTLEKDNVSEMMIYAFATPGLFAKIAGVMAANDLNILEAKQHLSKTGWGLVIFRFTDAQGHLIDEERRWSIIKKDLIEVLEEKIRVAQLMESRQKPSWYKKKLARTFPTRVEIDNDVSAYYTVIDIYTHDRVGLLYQILTTLSGLGLYVDVSKISTKVDQVADVFYVKDIFGQKIMQGEKLKKIQSELLKVIEEEK